MAVFFRRLVKFRLEEWQKWIRIFEIFRKATGLDERDQESQVSTLIYTMGEESDNIIVSFELTADQTKNYDAVYKSKFEEKLTLKRNVIFEQAKFSSRVQEQGETVYNLITELQAQICLVL